MFIQTLYPFENCAVSLSVVEFKCSLHIVDVSCMSDSSLPDLLSLLWIMAGVSSLHPQSRKDGKVDEVQLSHFMLLLLIS
jgi:hypothetical protein